MKYTYTVHIAGVFKFKKNKQKMFNQEDLSDV